MENTPNKINITNQNTFNKTMNILRYNHVKVLPNEIYNYVYEHQPDLSEFKDFFYDELMILKKKNPKRKITEINESAYKGYLNLIKYLHRKGQTWDMYAYLNAIIGGNLEVLKYLSQNGIPFIDPNDDIDYDNFYNSRYRCLDYDDDEMYDEHMCFYAAAYGHLDILKFLHKNKVEWSEWVSTAASKYNNLECLIYLRENGCQCSYNTCNYASRYGNLECLKYLHENGSKWCFETCINAIAYNNLECLKYAIENGCPYNDDTLECAVRNENLECLKYLHKVKCKSNKYLYETAGRNGKFESFKFLHQYGYPWSENTCFWAIAGSTYERMEFEEGIHLKILKYAIENGCSYDKEECILEAEESPDKNILKYLQNLI